MQTTSNKNLDEATAPALPRRAPAHELATCSLPALALTVRRALDSIGHDPTERFGERKVFIAAVHAALGGDAAIGLDAFKRRLVDAHQAGALVLARADLVAAMPQATVAASEIAADGAEFHFIIDDDAPDLLRQPPPSDAPNHLGSTLDARIAERDRDPRVQVIRQFATAIEGRADSWFKPGESLSDLITGSRDLTDWTPEHREMFLSTFLALATDDDLDALAQDAQVEIDRMAAHDAMRGPITVRDLIDRAIDLINEAKERTLSKNAPDGSPERLEIIARDVHLARARASLIRALATPEQRDAELRDVLTNLRPDSNVGHAARQLLLELALADDTSRIDGAALVPDGDVWAPRSRSRTDSPSERGPVSRNYPNPKMRFVDTSGPRAARCSRSTPGPAGGCGCAGSAIRRWPRSRPPMAWSTHRTRATGDRTGDRTRARSSARIASRMARRCGPDRSAPNCSPRR